jgi:hypothetical protein
MAEQIYPWRVQQSPFDPSVGSVGRHPAPWSAVLSVGRRARCRGRACSSLPFPAFLGDARALAARTSRKRQPAEISSEVPVAQTTSSPDYGAVSGHDRAGRQWRFVVRPEA